MRSRSRATCCIPPWWNPVGNHLWANDGPLAISRYVGGHLKSEHSLDLVLRLNDKLVVATVQILLGHSLTAAATAPHVGQTMCGDISPVGLHFCILQKVQSILFCTSCTLSESATNTEKYDTLISQFISSSLKVQPILFCTSCTVIWKYHLSNFELTLSLSVQTIL